MASSIMSSIKVRENRIRRIAERRGYLIQKSRRRDPYAHDFGGYMIVEPVRNMVIAGGTPNAYSLTLEDVEEFFAPPKGKQKAKK